MSDIVALNIDDIAPYEGPHAIPGVRFRAARAAVGVRSTRGAAHLRRQLRRLHGLG